MSCGLGAIILVFMLVKYNVEVAIPPNNNLESELDELQLEKKNLIEKLSTIRTITSQTESEILVVSKNLNTTKEKISKKKQEELIKNQVLDDLKKKIEDAEVKKSADIVEDQSAGEENYLIGLKVKGSKIVILVDSSSSMTDEKLLDVIRRKNLSDQKKRSGPKWQRAKKIVRWLLARLPKNSHVKVISFNDITIKVGNKSWAKSADASALGAIINDLDRLVPTGPTNLEAGLIEVAKFNPTNIYLITDGLPTKGSSGYKGLNPFAACNSLWGKSSTISGECREKLFFHTVSNSRTSLASKINVVLLPIEGDPNAATAYWSWASATGGIVISPAPSWP